MFTGQREITGLGIYHYQARFYSPRLGRFLSPDTIVPGAVNPQAYNRYSYVLNSPLNYIDPSGHGQCQTKEDCADMGTTPMGTGGSTGGSGGSGGSNNHGGSNSNGNPHDDVDPNPGCVGCEGNDNTTTTTETPPVTGTPSPLPVATPPQIPTETPYPYDEETYEYSTSSLVANTPILNFPGFTFEISPYSFGVSGNPFNISIPLIKIPATTVTIGAVSVSIDTYKVETQSVTIIYDQNDNPMGQPQVNTTSFTETNIYIDVGNIHCHGTMLGFDC